MFERLQPVGLCRDQVIARLELRGLRRKPDFLVDCRLVGEDAPEPFLLEILDERNAGRGVLHDYLIRSPSVSQLDDLALERRIFEPGAEDIEQEPRSLPVAPGRAHREVASGLGGERSIPALDHELEVRP